MALKKILVGRILYGILFCIILPIFLFWWASAIQVQLTIAHGWMSLGWLFSLAGTLLMIEAMWRLWQDGKGLPMNAYPPTRYVTRGSFALFRHPIYTGFFLLCAGVALINDSAEGFYVVTPVVALLCIALVTGFEQRNLEQRFSGQIHEPLFGIPTDINEAPTFGKRVALLFTAFVPWLVVYEILIHLNWNSGFVNSTLSFEKKLPVIEWAEIPYSLAYVFIVATPFILKTLSNARTFIKYCWMTTATGIFLQIVLPFYSEPRNFVPTTIFGEWIVWERSIDGPAASLPSFHVMWSLVAALFWSQRFPQFKFLWWSFAGLVALSCIGTGVHSLVDVLSAIVVFEMIYFRISIISSLQRGCEYLANSWMAWNIGNLRIINHSIYAGLAASIGIFMVSAFSIDYKVCLTVTVCAAIGGAIWGQYVEGSSVMLRPFGYFGALFGGIAGVGLSHFFLSADFLTTLGAFALAAPWTQALGRIRCLVQGCCHGRPFNGILSIRYNNEHTRVGKISALRNIPIHNTQAYSIISNFITGAVLLRLWYGELPPTFLTGIYFILTGCARFVEEAFRGEPQTQQVGQMSIYQWIAITFIIAGVLISALPSSANVIVFNPALSPESVFTIIACGIVWAFAMGMDFPKSNARFSRLTG